VPFLSSWNRSNNSGSARLRHQDGNDDEKSVDCRTIQRGNDWHFETSKRNECLYFIAHIEPAPLRVRFVVNRGWCIGVSSTGHIYPGTKFATGSGNDNTAHCPVVSRSSSDSRCSRLAPRKLAGGLSVADGIFRVAFRKLTLRLFRRRGAV